MLNIERILKQERLVRATTGLNLKALKALEPSFKEAYQQSLIKPEKERKRQLGGGRKPTLRTILDKMVYILLYLKCYPTFDLMGILFNFDKSSAHEWVHRLLPVLETALGKKQALPERKINSIGEFLERFPEVKEVIIDFNNVLFASSSAKITDLGNGSFAIAWEDGSGSNSFKSLGIKVEGSDESAIGTSLQGNSFGGKGGGEVIDLRSGLPAGTTSVTADFTVNREAAFNNFVGFYKVANTDGGIDTDGNGTIDFTPGQNGYIQAAIKGRVAGIDLAVSNQGTAQITGRNFEVNSIFAPFIIVNGTPDALLDSNTSNDPSVYFSHLGANTDGVDHIRMLGNNTFGFEDLAGGGDRDFNDVIIKATLTAVK